MISLSAIVEKGSGKICSIHRTGRFFPAYLFSAGEVMMIVDSVCGQRYPITMFHHARMQERKRKGE
jgi:hypothetical protein